jgi:hypothetical protein
MALYSDGVVEQWGERGAFGLGPLVEALRGGELAAGLAALEARLHAFAGPNGLADDATVVALALHSSVS